MPDKLITLENLEVFKQEMLEEIPPIDSSLSTISENPVQNKIITPILQGDWTNNLPRVGVTYRSQYDPANNNAQIYFNENTPCRRGWYRTTCSTQATSGYWDGLLLVSRCETITSGSQTRYAVAGYLFDYWMGDGLIIIFSTESASSLTFTMAIDYQSNRIATRATLAGYLAYPWSDSYTSRYRVGDYCSFKGAVYRCTRLNPSTPGSYNTGWTYVYDVSSMLDYFSNYSLAPLYSASATYNVGDYCTYRTRLYRCVSAITVAEAWTDAHWEAVLLTDEIKANAPVDITNMGGIGGAPIDDGIFDAAIAADRLTLTDSGVTLHYQLQAHSEDAGTQSEGAVFKTSLLDIQNNEVTDQFLVLTNIAGTRSVEVKTPVAAAINTAY